ncbi:MAG: thioredoxin family protein [Salibacteraceae bacterium]
MKKGKRLFNGLMGAAVACLLMALIPSSQGLNIGDGIPMRDAQLTDMDGNPAMIRSYMKENGLLVIFSCNTCPFVLQWEDRYNEIYDLASQNQIGMILVNSNEAKRTGDDSIEKMKEKAAKMGYKMPYLVDHNHMVADAFGARTTPHVYLFDRNGKLAYKGAIDDNSEHKDQVKQHYLKDAIKAVAQGQAPDPAETKAIGCSIKRVAK